MQSYSPVGQDIFLFENFFRGHRRGTFVDVGAGDGEKNSNTLFFERYMDWSGLCIEPMPAEFEKLAAKRKSVCKQVYIGDFEGAVGLTEATGVDERTLNELTRNCNPNHVERLRAFVREILAYKVPVRHLSSVLAECSIVNADYCSIDTKGSEINIVSSFDFEMFPISVLTIRDDFGDERIQRVMAKKGYDFVARFEQQSMFKRQNVKRLARTTVICAVWHGDPHRWELLRGHLANLRRQSVPIETVYVFDGADMAPEWLNAKTVSVQQELSIYQAWNVGLSLVSTPLVLNLNLDDRLASNAIELLENTLIHEGASAIGGEWKICFSQNETDETKDCYPADDLPFVSDWPPKKGSITCLGSGIGKRGTLGPAVMWRMDAHIGFPRYPWRTTDGTVLRVAGDAIWWGLLSGHLQKKIVRIPTIIGNYYSHPKDQAEFRQSPDDEMQLVNQVGISSL